MPKEHPKRLLLHACCGPCSMEPVRILLAQGITPHIFYSNSNIAPYDEYERRSATAKDFAILNDLEFIEDAYDPNAWHEKVAKEYASDHDRHARCRACYKIRFASSAQYAKEHGFDALGTTLSVSPYQYTDTIREELESACEDAGVDPYFEDYSPFYPDSVRRSKEAGMYRQNYCGCGFSLAEAEAERKERQELRQIQKEAKAKKRELEQMQIDARKRERAEYDAKQARKRRLLKEFKANENMKEDIA